MVQMTQNSHAHYKNLLKRFLTCLQLFGEQQALQCQCSSIDYTVTMLPMSILQFTLSVQFNAISKLIQKFSRFLFLLLLHNKCNHINKINLFMPRANKRSRILKQTCSFQLLPSSIKRLSLQVVMDRSSCPEVFF